MSTDEIPLPSKKLERADSGGSRKGLRGRISSVGLLFMVLSFNAPLGVIAGYAGPQMTLGNGIGAPVMFIACSLMLALFAVGYTTMARYLPKPGGFYTYISHGLGRVVGLGFAYIALISYFFALLGTYPYAGLTLNELVHGTLHGPDLPWYAWALALLVITGVLGYFNVELSAKVLSVCLVAEVAIILIVSIAVTAQGGAEGIHFNTFDPNVFLAGSLGAGLIFGVLNFGGFESAAIFRDEARDPDRAIPRATFGHIILACTVYAFGTWALIQAFGESSILQAATDDPAGIFFTAANNYVGGTARDVALVLVNTSLFAALLACHGVFTRYLFNLSRDRILPRFLGAVHKKHSSPHLASLFVSGLSFALLAFFVVIQTNAETLYARLVGVFGFTVLFMLLATSVAALVYLNRHFKQAVSLWRRTIAPSLAIIVLSVACSLAVANFEPIVGLGGLLGNIFMAALVVVLVGGSMHALILRRTKPDIFQRIGRQ